MTADDVKAETWVTVIRWREDATGWAATEAASFSLMMGVSTPRANRSYMGEALRVEAVSLPYVIVGRLSGELVTLDLRLCELTPLAPAFVEALKKRHATNKPSDGRTLVIPGGYGTYSIQVSSGVLGDATKPTDETDDDGDDD